jgi:hypothetical protein
MRFCTVIGLGIMTVFASPASGDTQPNSELAGNSNTAPLIGGVPMNWGVQPPLPADGFYAVCYTSAGTCSVHGNAPIAPRSACYCVTYAGRTE